MKLSKSHWLYLFACISFLAVGIPYWKIPFHEVTLFEALLTPVLIVVVLSAVLLQMYTEVSFWRTTSVIGITVAAAVMARVLVEGVQDPTSHNLWPFEVIIALIIGFPCAAAGAALGSLIAEYLPNPPRGDKI